MKHYAISFVGWLAVISVGFFAEKGAVATAALLAFFGAAALAHTAFVAAQSEKR